MCGIFGLVALGRPVRAEEVPLVERGVELLAHRGPDGDGVVVRDSVCFGHRRLAIVDVEGGRQPMWSADGRGLISYNGEVYNFLDLERELRGRGRRFVNRCDTECVLNAYLEWGDDSLVRLRGMFAFAAVDFGRNRAILARDRLGIKPLYYTFKDGALYWSSELEPLYRTAGPFPLDLEALDDYLSWQYVAAPKTIYTGVRCLPPAHYLSIDLSSGTFDERRYWSLSFNEDRSLDVHEWGERIDAAIRESVRVRLMSDVPFGAFLSGGVDSSIVVGYMAELMDRPVDTFTIGFHEADFSETAYADEVSRLNRTKQHTEIVDAKSIELLPLLARHYGQPFADSSAIPTYYLSRVTSQHVKMALSGDGGDENFAGYNSYEYVATQMEALATRPAPPARGNWFRALAGHYYRKLRLQLVSASDIDLAYELHGVTSHHFHASERRQLFAPSFRDVVRTSQPERRGLLDVDGAPIVSRLQHLDLMAYLPFDILTKVDVASMANSLEVRVPLLDHHLVEIAATVPVELKLKREIVDATVRYDKKHLLKRVAKRRYPAALIDRPKMGFGVPIGEWMAGRLRPDVEERLLRSPYLGHLFDMSWVRSLWQRHLAQRDCTPKIWNLLFLEEWMKSHPDAMPNRAAAGVRQTVAAG
jgi:asparagine synthase (glutamine-hydrolysing)